MIRADPDEHSRHRAYERGQGKKSNDGTRKNRIRWAVPVESGSPPREGISSEFHRAHRRLQSPLDVSHLLRGFEKQGKRTRPWKRGSSETEEESTSDDNDCDASGRECEDLGAEEPLGWKDASACSSSSCSEDEVQYDNL